MTSHALFSSLPCIPVIIYEALKLQISITGIGRKSYLANDLVLHLGPRGLLLHLIMHLVVREHRGVLLHGLLLLLLYLRANHKHRRRGEGEPGGNFSHHMARHANNGESTYGVGPAAGLPSGGRASLRPGGGSRSPHRRRHRRRRPSVAAPAAAAHGTRTVPVSSSGAAARTSASWRRRRTGRGRCRFLRPELQPVPLHRGGGGERPVQSALEGQTL
jgi:hypothetical protein